MSVNTTHITQARSESLDHRIVGAGAVIAGLASLVVANFVTPGDNGGATEFAATGTFMLVVAAIVFGLVVPRARENGRLVGAALILTALSVLGGIAFWSGLGQVTAPAAVLLGYLALDRDGSSRGGAWTAIVLAGLLYAGILTACVVG